MSTGESTIQEIRLLLAEKEKHSQQLRSIDEKIAALVGFLPSGKVRKEKKATFSNAGFIAACNSKGARA